MIDFESNLGLKNSNWLMSTSEKIALIGILHCLKPKSVIEFGYHLGGATKWLSEFSERVITVDTNKNVLNAQKEFNNVVGWNCLTTTAIKRIEEQKLKFDLAIIDADHSRKGVALDILGLLKCSRVIVMHDSFNPSCRRGMLQILENQNSHAYNLDFISSSVKYDGLWGGLGVVWRSEKPVQQKQFLKEKSLYNIAYLQSLLEIKGNLVSFQRLSFVKIKLIICKLKIFLGKFKSFFRN